MDPRDTQRRPADNYNPDDYGWLDAGFPVRDPGLEKFGCRGGGTIGWRGDQADVVPERLFCPVCGLIMAPDIKRGERDLTARVRPHYEDRGVVRWVRKHAKVLSIWVSICAVAYVWSTFRDEYFSVGGSWSANSLLRPLGALTTNRHVLSFPEQGQWENKIEFVVTEWWGIKEYRYPMRFAANFDSGKRVMLWEIKTDGGKWTSFFEYGP